MKTSIDNIPCEINRQQLFERLHVEPDSPFYERVQELIETAIKIGKPKIAYRLAYIDQKGDDFVIVDGVRFTSRVLRVNLDETYKVIPFVVTCGTELEKWARSFEDAYDVYCLDAIMEAVLRCAASKIFTELDDKFKLGRTANMSPGSLKDWPINEQKPLFELLGDIRSLIGVELKESYLMSPIKTISGFHFPKEGGYESCQLCPREGCPGRRAPYDENLYDEKYLQSPPIA